MFLSEWSSIFMKRFKSRLITLIALFAVTLSAAFGSFFYSVGANAEETYTPDGIFSAGTGGTVTASEETEGNSYVQFTFKDGGAVHYRQDLALKWYEQKGAASYFSVVFAFPEIGFSEFTLTFESAQENVSKDGTTSNSLIFTAGADNAVTAAVKNAEEETGAAVAVDATGDVTISFANDVNGDFDVLVNGTKVGTFTNIGGYFMEYLSSSSSTPRIPITFTADLKEGTEEQTVLVKSLNNQSLQLEEGKVKDDAAPVLVVNEAVKSFQLGYKFSLSYEAIDVCDESVSVTRQYYMAGMPQEEDAEEIEYESLSTSTYFLPLTEGSTEEKVSIRFKLTDDGQNGNDDYVYLAWYAENVTTEDEIDYIPVVRDSDGPVYLCSTNDDATKTSSLDENNPAYLDYADAVKAAAEGLNAGEGAYFYLPSLRGLLSDNDTDYRNFTFSVYYKKQSSSTSQSETSLKYNTLKFEIDEEGSYSFRVLVTDKLGNGLKVYQDGRLVSVTSSNIWDIDAIPQFDFEVYSTGATIEKADEQALGYLDSTYNIDDFEIIALSGYQVDYTLYFFDTEAYFADHNKYPSYSDLVADPEAYATEKYLRSIQEYDSTISEDDPAWDRTDNDYEWKPSSLSFRPQEAGFYFVKAEVTDANYWSEEDRAIAYQVIEVSNPIDEISGETYWLQNNIVSVVLLGVCVVLAIAIVVLFLIKPSEKNVEEVDLSKLKGKKKNTDKK